MDSKIEERFKKSNNSWNYSTVIGGKVVETSQIVEIKPPEKQPDEPIELIEPQELSKELRKIYKIPEVQKNTIIFESLEDFNRWYLSNRAKFSSRTMVEALNTLISIEHLVTQGCKCKETERRGAAYGYYQGFFMKNSKTDIISTIKSIAGCDVVSFKSPETLEPFLTT